MWCALQAIHEVYEILHTGLTSGDPIGYFNLATNLADSVSLAVPCYIYSSKAFDLMELINLLHRPGALISAPFRKNQEKVCTSIVAIVPIDACLSIYLKMLSFSWNTNQ
jgi:hypothetical protein